MRDRIEKVIQVDDPEVWYGEDTIKVALYILPLLDDTVSVRITVNTIDDFSLLYEQICPEDCSVDIDLTYKHMKKWMFDTIPKTVNLGWFYRHGYVNN